jgi:hypothetical protein
VWVAEVFISYSRVDRERVAAIAERLASLGYSTFWDASHHAAGEHQLEAARAVIVVWSASARNSSWVCAEASRALDAGMLIQLRIDAAQPPAPFDGVTTADMSGGRAEWGPLEAALAQLVRGEAQASPPPFQLGALAAPPMAGAPKLLTTALVTSILAYCGALTATRDGVMTPSQLQLALTGMIGVAVACAAISLYRLIAVSRAGG